MDLKFSSRQEIFMDSSGNGTRYGGTSVAFSTHETLKWMLQRWRLNIWMIWRSCKSPVVKYKYNAVVPSAKA